MTIEFAAPLNRAYQRMVAALFKPFLLNTWLVVGFTAFLDGLMQGGGHGGAQWNKHRPVDLGEILTAPYTAQEWLKAHSGWMALIIIGIIAVIALCALLLWISSRGKFMFLDNVVQKRALISPPWHDYRREGNSLFRWRLVFMLIVMAIIGAILHHVWRIAYQKWVETEDFWTILPSLVSWGLFLLVGLMAVAYIGMLLNGFVIPMMYKHRISATQAWNRFLLIHWPNLGSFILYGLLIFVLHLAVVVGVVVVGLFTCCLGFVLMAIPYVNAVVLLPISYGFRCFSIEFLAQFGPEYDVRE